MKNLPQVVRFLRRLGRKGSIPRDKGAGLCSNFQQEFGYDIQNLPDYRKIVMAWCHYGENGSVVFPVPAGQKGISASWAYLSGRRYWTGKYGENRRAFTRYLAREYAKLLKTA